MNYTIISSLNEAEWLESRKQGIGGSEIAAILGLDEYRTPLDVYLDKKGREINYTDEQLDDFDRGHWFEVPLLEWLHQQSGVPSFVHNTSLYVSNENPIIRCTPDGVGNDITIEAKSTKLYAKEPLQKWFLQLQYNMGITGHSKGIIVWIDCTMKRYYEEYNRNDELIQLLQKEAQKFWDKHIVMDVPPQPMNAKDVVNLYPTHLDGKSYDLSVEEYDIFNSFKDASAQKKIFEEQEEAYKEKLKVLMKDAEYLTYSGLVLATYKGNEERRLDSKELKKAEPSIFEKYAHTKIVRKFLPKFK